MPAERKEITGGRIYVDVEINTDDSPQTTILANSGYHWKLQIDNNADGNPDGGYIELTPTQIEIGFDDGTNFIRINAAGITTNPAVPPAAHTHVEVDITDLDHYNAADFAVDFAAEDLANLGTKAHGSLTGIGANDHHAQVHTHLLVAGATDVTSTAAELNTLDGFLGDVNDFNNIIDTGRTQGDLLYASANNTLAWLARGNDNDILRMNGNVPNWEVMPSFATEAYVDAIDHKEIQHAGPEQLVTFTISSRHGATWTCANTATGAYIILSFRTDIGATYRMRVRYTQLTAVVAVDFTIGYFCGGDGDAGAWTTFSEQLPAAGASDQIKIFNSSTDIVATADDHIGFYFHKTQNEGGTGLLHIYSITLVKQ